MKFLAFFFLVIFSSSVLSDVEYCPGVKMKGRKMKFTDTEKGLFCGDEKSHAWKHIPAYQAEQVLRGLLQSRGYLRPTFHTENKVLIVKKGPKSEIRRIEVVSGEKNLGKKIRREVRRLYKGRELTTSMLNSVEGEGQAQIRRRGYPCGKVSSEVDVTTDTVTLIIDPKKKQKFGTITKEKIDGLRDSALLRFYPMKEDQRFNGDLLELTEKRLLRAEVVQGTYFLENCPEDGKSFSLEQRFITGPPRTLRFGAGASTEAGPLARARWSNNRTGPMASVLSATVEASLRVQSLNLSADYFPWEKKPRDSIFSEIEVIRESQFKYEQFLTRFQPQYKWTRDIHQHGTTWMLGPGYENGTYHSQDKTETRTWSTAVLEGSFQRTAHQYELFDVHPQDGDQEAITISYRNPMLGFQESLTRIDTSFVRLGRIGNSGRGALVGGVRFKAGSAFVKSTTDLTALPPEVKFFGGGSDDLRGYLLRTLPRNGGAGALTRVLTKAELRRTHFFHEKVESFLFWDAGQFGSTSFSASPRIWHSPGVGLRWLSPIGVLQGYWARALATHPAEDNGNFFFAGLGGTF